MVGKIVSKEEVAKGTLQVIFEINEELTFKPGQYCFVTLNNLNYPDDRGNRRQFSINNSPNQKGIIQITTRLSESGFKKTLKEIPIGTEVTLGPIAGVFTLPEDTLKPLVFIAGGIGITPFLSMLKYLEETKLPYKVTLLYSNRNKSSAAYSSELENLKFKIENFKLILTMTDDPNWSGEKRKIDAQFIKEYFPGINENQYMVVGPPAMVDAVRKSLSEAGVLNENIKFENFIGY